MCCILTSQHASHLRFRALNLYFLCITLAKNYLQLFYRWRRLPALLSYVFIQIFGSVFFCQQSMQNSPNAWNISAELVLHSIHVDDDLALDITDWYHHTMDFKTWGLKFSIRQPEKKRRNHNHIMNWKESLSFKRDRARGGGDCEDGGARIAGARQELERQYVLALRMAKSGVQQGYDRGCA